jgi:cytochrome c556
VINYGKIISGGSTMFRRSKISGLFIVILVLSFAILTGCSKPPTEELAKADKAMEEAKQKEAPAYAPDLFSKAEGTLKQAKDYVTDKKYKEAKQAAIDAEAAFQQAIAGIEAGKTKMKAEAEQAVQDVQKELDELKATVAALGKNKALVKARDEAQEVVTKLEADFTAAKEKLQGNIREVKDQLKTMKEQISAKKEELTNLNPPSK